LVRFWLQAGRVLVLAGSLPSGAPADIYAQLTRIARQRGAKVFLDADGEPLRLGLAAGPSIIKPNVEEAERVLDRPLPDEAAILAGARELVGRGVETVIVSMGGRGAVCAQRARAWRIHPPEVKRLSTVGSGDAMVAGIAVALARGDDLAGALALGTAAGAATAMSEGTALGSADDVAALLPQVRIEEMA
jgi:1-phosphofructokinase family hexose kinase